MGRIARVVHTVRERAASMRPARARRACIALALCARALTLVFAGAGVLAIVVARTPLPSELRHLDDPRGSVRFYDRDGGLLREVRAGDATRARRAPLEEMGERLAAAIVAAEDRRFYRHIGVDPFAVVRAVASSLLHRRIVSGASTLTMQLARAVRPHPRTLRGKVGEMVLALRIEASLSKRAILEEYLNRVSFGPGLRGLDAASRFYLDKDPARLSLAEAATLAAIPRGPAVYALDRHPGRGLRRRDRILDRMRGAGVIGIDVWERARAEPLALHLSRGTFGAPHFVQALVASSLDGALAADRRAGGAFDPRIEAVTTTISRPIQREAEVVVASTIAALGRRHVTSASTIVLDNATGDVLAYVGSPDFFDGLHGGQNDGVRARRQPGSALKPFLYELAFERLGYTASTVLEDIAIHIPVGSGVYAPLNYDERFHGPVRVREALGSSLNIPAVATLAAMGVEPFLQRLRALGFDSLEGSPEFYGPGLALGDGEVTLAELANAYATLARRGAWRPLRFVRSVVRSGRDADVAGGDIVADGGAGDAPVLDPRAVAVITDILRDPRARLAGFGERSALDLSFDVAAKTGTSKGYRDNWAVGFTREVTVAVWVGNFDGSSMEGVSGITGAGPIFRAVMEAAMRGRTSSPLALDHAPESDREGLARVEVCPLSGRAPTHACGSSIHEWLPRELAALPRCDMHETVAIDRRNGLRATLGCARSVVVERTFERFGGELAAWAKAARRDVAPEASSPLCPPPNHHDRRDHGDARASIRSPLRIVYPHAGARFLVDPDRPLAHQTLDIGVDAPLGVRMFDVLVDGRPLARVPTARPARWQLERGAHTVAAYAEGVGWSDAVEFRVE